MPIALEPDDEFYSQFDQGCMNFVRSALAPDGQCELSYGKQVKKNMQILFKIMRIFYRRMAHVGEISDKQSDTFHRCIRNLWL